MMSGPFLWTRQKAGRLSGWRVCSGSTRLMDAHPVLNGSLKDIDVYDCEISELDAMRVIHAPCSLRQLYPERRHVYMKDGLFRERM